jgi:hypothetical protein
MGFSADDDPPEWIRRLREQSRQDAEALVPRPGYPVRGLAAPVLTPATVTETRQVGGEWTAITLMYGSWDAPGGPHLRVTTASADLTRPATLYGSGLEAELRHAIELERGWAATRAGEFAAAEDAADATAWSATGGGAAATRERLPLGDVLILRDGEVWAARLLADDQVTGDQVTAEGPTAGPAALVVVTLVGRSVDPAAVQLSTVADLRPMLDARYRELGRMAERRRSQPPAPPPELEPATGVDTLRALADFSLRRRGERRSWLGTGPSPAYGRAWGRMRLALWQRAVREQQQLGEMDKRTAEDVVTSAITHLEHLAEHAEWFAASPRLREAAIDETLRRAMLEDRVPSEPAQRAWARYWSTYRSRARLGLDPAEDEALPALDAEVLAAWASWAASA